VKEEAQTEDRTADRLLSVVVSGSQSMGELPDVHLLIWAS